MKRLVAILLLSIAVSAMAQERFAAMDLVIDPKGEALAAYQVEITAPAGVKIVGVEGGEHPEFRKAPYYDPQGIQHERLIVAAFSVAAADKLPKAATRVLTIHLEIEGANFPELKTDLKVAANPRGQKLAATVKLKERKQP